MGGISLGVLHIIIRLNTYWVPDFLIILLGIASQATLYYLTGIARSTVVLFIPLAASMFYSISPPSIRSHLTKITSSKEYWAVLGVLSLIHVLWQIVVNLLAWVYVNKQYIQELCFFVISGVCIIRIIMLWVAYIVKKEWDVRVLFRNWHMILFKTWSFRPNCSAFICSTCSVFIIKLVPYLIFWTV